ncbi:hypothetical protein Esti_002976 [Eimeria stiedai]
MAGVALNALPEALLTVAEKTLSSQQPLLFGLSGPQLSRIAREVYVHLKNSGKEVLAQQAQALTDPALLAKALQLLQLQGKHTNSVTVCPCCSLGPPGSVSHGSPQQPQVVPVVVQPVPQPLLQQPMQTPQQQLQPQHARHQGLPTVLRSPAECLDQQQQQQQQQPSLSRKACVARLIFALMAAKLVKDLLASRQGSTSSSSSSRSSSMSRGKRKTGAGGDAEVSGLGAVSVDSLAEPLAPRSGLFAGLPPDLLVSLQRVVASAMGGVAAAAGAAGYGPSKEGKSVDGREMPPLYLSPAQQGRVELTEHEKYAGELIEELLRLPGGRPIESIRSDMLKEPQRKPLQQEQQQQQRGGAVKGEPATNSVGAVKQQAQKRAAAETEDEGASVDATFQAFVRRAEEHKGPSPLSIEQQLRFYGLYKRATAGPCTAKQPSRFNLKEYRKWEAWKACDRMSAVEAKKEYVERAKQLEKMQARL